MNALGKYLQQFPGFTAEAYESAIPYFTEKVIPPEEYLLRVGKIAKYIAFIERGLFRQYYLHKGKEMTNCFCRENTITTSYKSLITQEASEIAIQAVEESKIILLSYDSLQKLYTESVFWQQIGRLESEHEYIRTESHNRFIKDSSATDRYLEVLNNDPELVNRVPLGHLASYLQIAPETLSRIRKKISRT